MAIISSGNYQRKMMAGLLAASMLMPVAAQANDHESVDARLDRLEAMITALQDQMANQQASTAQADAVNQLGAAVVETRAQNQALAEQQAATEARVAQVEKSDRSGFHVGDTAISIGGYVKFDAISSRTSAGQLANDSIVRDFLIPSTIPVGAGNDSGWDTDFSARQSRFNIKTSTPVGDKSVNTLIELDFMATPGDGERTTNSYTPRIRQAIVSYDGWTIGQTWSTFFNVGALPDTLDFIGTTPGTVFIRQPMIRYTTKGGLSFAVENPESTITTSTGGRLVPGDDGLPDIVARYDLKSGRNSFSIAAIGRQLKVTNDDFGLGSDSTLGYGVSLAGTIGIGAKDDFRFMFNAGEGLGRYIGLNIVNGAAIDPVTGKLDAIASYSGFGAYRHVWSPKLRSTIAGSYFKADNPVLLTGGSPTDTVWNALANIIYSPVPKLDFGLEYMYAERENEAGLSGNLQKLQMSAKYSF